MKERVFETLNGKALTVKHRKSAVTFEVQLSKNEKPDFHFKFSPEDFKAFAAYMESVANDVWSNFTPKDATSEASDYCEYYDKEFDNNGYLRIIEDGIKVEGPHNTTGRLYQFTKSKLQSFIFDLRK